MTDIVIYDPYPNETKSINEMPDECPVKYLTYGVLTEKILPLVTENRRKSQKERREFLIKKD